MCEITGRRRHSKDLAQGGLEILYTLTFEGGSKDITKVKKLIKKLLAIPAQQEETSADEKHPQNMPVNMSILGRRHTHGLTKMLRLKPFAMEKS